MTPRLQQRKVVTHEPQTVIWIVSGVLAAAVVAAVGIVSYHVGFDHGQARVVVARSHG